LELELVRLRAERTERHLAAMREGQELNAAAKME
jgi:hypothetical protein